MKKNTLPPHNMRLPSADDLARFERARHKVIDQSQGLNGIGTLNEKTIHAVLKHYYSEDDTYHEKRVHAYVADLLINNQILEIQTRNFNALRKKLDAFLSDYDVTIIYPVPYTKWLCWIDLETGEISPKRKSPKKGTVYSIIRELYRIKNYLMHPNLHFIITFLNVEEYRILNGWSRDKKKGSTRKDGLPIGIVGEVHIDTIDDFNKLLPDHLPIPFTTNDYKKAAKVTQAVASTGLNILYSVGIIERIGKQGNAYLYKKSQEETTSITD